MNLGKIQGFLPLQLASHIVSAVLSMVVSSILAWIVLIQKFWHGAKLNLIAWSVERDN